VNTRALTSGLHIDFDLVTTCAAGQIRAREGIALGE